MNLGTALRTRNSSQFPTFLWPWHAFGEVKSRFFNGRVGVNVLNNALWSIYALLIEA